jgi:hypothetical protein
MLSVFKNLKTIGILLGIVTVVLVVSFVLKYWWLLSLLVGGYFVYKLFKK